MGFIQEQNIFLNQIGQTQNDIFEFLAKKTVDLTIADNQKEVLEKLIERENEGTTGMMDGFAIPHAKAKRKSSVAKFGWSANPIYYCFVCSRYTS